MKEINVLKRLGSKWPVPVEPYVLAGSIYQTNVANISAAKETNTHLAGDYFVGVGGVCGVAA